MILFQNIKTDIHAAGCLDILVQGERIAAIGKNIAAPEAVVYDMRGALVLPGAVDVHVHLRDPGFTHKETVRTGTLAAAKGGVTALMAMPNTDPVIDTLAAWRGLQAKIRSDAVVRVYPFASVTMGEKGEMLSELIRMPGAARRFSDDGTGVNKLSLLEEAMRLVEAAGGIIASHAEAEGLGTSPEAETVAVERELALAKKTGCRYHFCHLSVRKSFELVRKAKQEGVDVTCEVTPHHLFLCEDDNQGDPDFKMNPPLRKKEDCLAALEAVLDGTADMIATDHAPHAAAEKAWGYLAAPNGIIGLETMLPLLITHLLKPGIITTEQLIRITSGNPAKRFGIPYGEIKAGGLADLAFWETETSYLYQAENIRSKSKNSPFIGQTLYGKNICTVLNGSVIYTSGTEAAQ